MWTSAFGDGDPDLERRMGRPENELPTALPMNRLLVRTPDVAVALLGVQAYTTGVAFEVAARARGPEDAAGEDGLGRLFWDHRGGARASCSASSSPTAGGRATPGSVKAMAT